MARRRLSPPSFQPGFEPGAAPDVPRAEHFDRPPRSAGAAPIARVAAEAASTAALDEVVETLRRAREEGRLVIEIPLDDIAADHIVRDRLAAGAGEADEETQALRESLRAHGQRMPIEVTPLRGPASDEGDDGGFSRGLLSFGLISGWRRLAALRALHAETGEERFATVRALVRRPENAAAAYVAMVEENEIRLGLGQYERARIAAVATARGVFPSEKAALLALFASASRAKRSRIRAFLEIYHALDGALRFPAHLPERLGLELVERIRAGEGAGIAAALAAADPADPEAELATLAAWLAAAPAGTPPEAPSGARSEAPREDPARDGGGREEAGQGGRGDPAWSLLPGVDLRSELRGRSLTLRLTGEGVTPALRDRVLALFSTLEV